MAADKIIRLNAFASDLCALCSGWIALLLALASISKRAVADAFFANLYVIQFSPPVCAVMPKPKSGCELTSCCHMMIIIGIKTVWEIGMETLLCCGDAASAAHTPHTM